MRRMIEAVRGCHRELPTVDEILKPYTGKTSDELKTCKGTLREILSAQFVLRMKENGTHIPGKIDSVFGRLKNMIRSHQPLPIIPAEDAAVPTSEKPDNQQERNQNNENTGNQSG